MIDVTRKIEEGILDSRDNLISQIVGADIPIIPSGKPDKARQREVWSRYQSLPTAQRSEFVRRGLSAQNPLPTAGEVSQERARFEENMLKKFGISEEVLLNAV